MKIRKGDLVKIQTGKDKNRTGIVELVNNRKGKILVGGVNLYKKHLKKRDKFEGGIIEFPKSLDLSNVSLVCPSCSEVTRIGIKKEGKKSIRICVKCKAEIDKIKKEKKTKEVETKKEIKKETTKTKTKVK